MPRPPHHLPQHQPPAGSANKLHSSIYVIGIVSFFNDIATEMVTPLIPLLLATTLATGPVILGLVEGLAAAVACGFQLWAGNWSDQPGRRRKPLAVGGYLLSNAMRPLLALATHWSHVVLVRALDRVGKGIRTAPRDALIVDLTPPHLLARAFSIYRGFDNLGAVGGALVGAWVLAAFSTSLQQMLLISVIPGLLCVALFAWGVAEPPAKPASPLINQRMAWSTVSRPMRHYLLLLVFFTFSRAAELFVILRAHELGASPVHALLLWAALNLAKVLANYASSRFADRYGHLALLFPGWLLHAAAMLAFCLVASLGALWMAAIFFGLATALSEGVERAVIGHHAGEYQRGTLFGWYYTLIGLASIPAGLLLGGLWQMGGASLAYGFAAAVALIAALLLRFRIAAPLSAQPVSSRTTS